MITAHHGSRPCDLGTEPNRQGYLILGDCPIVETAFPETCPPGPADPNFGILPCRCLESRFRIIGVQVGTVTLGVRDKIWIPIQVVVEIDL